jgi:hypothetical protein
MLSLYWDELDILGGRSLSEAHPILFNWQASKQATPARQLLYFSNPSNSVAIVTLVIDFLLLYNKKR